MGVYLGYSRSLFYCDQNTFFEFPFCPRPCSLELVPDDVFGYVFRGSQSDNIDLDGMMVTFPRVCVDTPSALNPVSPGSDWQRVAYFPCGRKWVVEN